MNAPALALHRFQTGGVELASGKVAELVKSFEHVNEILEGWLILWVFDLVKNWWCAKLHQPRT